MPIEKIMPFGFSQAMVKCWDGFNHVLRQSIANFRFLYR